MTDAHEVPSLSTEQLTEVLELLKGADSVELKLTVPDAHRRSAVEALGMDILAAQIRQVVFFDTPDLQLYGRGVVVRARRVQNREADSVVKLRPVVPAELPASLHTHRMFGIEVDAMPGGFVCSASMKARHEDDLVKAVFDGDKATRKVFSKQQRAFYADHAPEGLELDDLVPLGPISVLKLKFEPAGYAHKLVAEIWFYPDGSRILELSTKCAPADAFTVAAETKAYLGERGVDLLAEQQTKTRTALDFFSAELAAATD